MERERAQTEIDFCLQAHGHGLHGCKLADIEPEDKSVSSLPTQPDIDLYSAGSKRKYIDPKGAIDEVAVDDEEETTLTDEIRAILQEDQEHVLSGRISSPGDNIKFHLLDVRYPADNPFCPHQIVEDDYSENSCP